MLRMMAFVCLVVSSTFGVVSCAEPEARAEAPAPIVRVVAYNVEFGARGTPEQIAQMLAPLKPDVVLLNELPAGDWAARLGKGLGLDHAHVGETSSANHKDKYRGVVSRTPLENASETLLEGRGWSPASVVRAETVIAGRRVALYSLHISGGHGASPDVDRTQAADLFRRVLRAEKLDHVLVGGDFNDCIDTPVMKLHEAAGYRATWADLDIDLAPRKTWNAAGEQDEGVIDHILYRRTPGAKALDGGIVTSDPALADHWPVWAAIRLGDADNADAP